MGPDHNTAQKEDAVVASVRVIITITLNFCKTEDIPFRTSLLEYSDAEEVWCCSSAMGLCLHLELLK